MPEEVKPGPLAFKASVSDDGRLVRLRFEAQSTDAILQAQDLERLMDHLAHLRAQLKPPVGVGKSPLTVEGTPQDAMSPRTDVALQEGDLPLVALAIAFPGLGWRVAVMSQDRAAALGRQLLAHGDSPPIRLQ